MGNPALTELQDKIVENVFRRLDTGALQAWSSVKPLVAEAIREEVATWSAKSKPVHVTPRGRSFDPADTDLHPLDPDVGQPENRDAIQVTGTFKFTRPLTTDEQTLTEMRRAAFEWKMSDQSTPPPRGVPTTTLLDQATWWIPKDADPILLTDINDSWRPNLIAFLERNAAKYKSAEEWEFLGLITGPLGPSGDMAQDSCDAAMEDLMHQQPQDWIAEKPLFKELLRLEKAAKRRAKRRAQRAAKEKK
jgi:hypothetical protein